MQQSILQYWKTKLKQCCEQLLPIHCKHAGTDTLSAITSFYVFSMSPVIALASAIFMAVNAYLNKNLEQKTASFYSEKAMRM